MIMAKWGAPHGGQYRNYYIDTLAFYLIWNPYDDPMPEYGIDWHPFLKWVVR